MNTYHVCHLFTVLMQGRILWHISALLLWELRRLSIKHLELSCLEATSVCFDDKQADLRVCHTKSSIFQHPTCRVVRTLKFAPGWWSHCRYPLPYRPLFCIRLRARYPNSVCCLSVHAIKAYTICIFVYYEFAKKPPVLMSLPASDTLGNADIIAYHGPTWHVLWLQRQIL